MNEELKQSYGIGKNGSTKKIQLPKLDYTYLIHCCQYECICVKKKDRMNKTKELTKIHSILINEINYLAIYYREINNPKKNA